MHHTVQQNMTPSSLVAPFCVGSPLNPRKRCIFSARGTGYLGVPKMLWDLDNGALVHVETANVQGGRLDTLMSSYVCYFRSHFLCLKWAIICVLCCSLGLSDIFTEQA